MAHLVKYLPYKPEAPSSVPRFTCNLGSEVRFGAKQIPEAS